MNLLENVPLAAHTTFALGGVARFFCVVSSVGDLHKAVEYAAQKKIPFFVLGGGSNILVNEVGFSGLVIKMDIKGVVFDTRIQEGEVYVTAGAGESWDSFVAGTVEKGLWGLENLSLIPGTVGASPVQNIGAYGVEAKDCIDSVRVFDISLGVEKVFTRAQCEFGYRDSVFKRIESKKYIITAVTFRLHIKPTLKLSYRDLKEYFLARNNTNPSQKEIRDAVIAIRTEKFPDVSVVGTAGSFWKNPIITKSHFEKLKTVWPAMPSFPADGDNVKVPLAYILDAVCNLKGYTQGPSGSSVGLFKKQPLVLVAEKGSTAADVMKLADYVAKQVKEKTQISIEREVEYL